ncbi:MAG: hypothetical protein HYY20_07110 [Candidatus Tectomicrobia bacterium]|uniref:Tetratricopeptide repeat protein n=1 Tax=Tectimicrobiota bacterium TaxID=2528274 RepID=A0A932CNY3_UNCTE|nr:hypothetical protein [Candidatus Tectomicrobia bacterium]
MVEILSDFLRHLEDDTYRFQVARDRSGRNLYKVTLIRLNNYEKIYPNSQFQPIISFNKAKAYEKLHEYDLAIQSYQDVLNYSSPLAELAQKNIAICQELSEMSQRSQDGLLPQELLSALEKAVQDWERLVEKYRGTPYEHLAREQQERVEWEKVAFTEAHTGTWQEAEQVIQQYNALISRHAESKNLNRYLLHLGDFYARMASHYAEKEDPHGLRFDFKKFEKFADTALELYESVASKDGISEKLEAKDKVKALISYIRTVKKISQ